MVDASSMRDLRAVSTVAEKLEQPTDYKPPRTQVKQYYCVSCAIHARIVRVRSREGRRVRGRGRQ